MFLSSFAKFFRTGSEYMAYLFVMRKFEFRGYKVSYPRKSDSLACCLATVTVVKNFTLNYSTVAQLSRDVLLIRFCSLCSDSSLLKTFLLLLLFHSYCSTVIIW